MAKFLAGVLSVITVGVLLIAYGLLSPRVGASGSPAEFNQFARPMAVGDSMMMPTADRYLTPGPAGFNYPAANGYAHYPAAPYGYAYPTAPNGYGYPAAQPIAVSQVRPVQTVQTAPAPRRSVVRSDRPRRDWGKAALIIGGSTAGGAGLGGIFGGKKGALIGAAIGGGASTIYEATKK